MKVWLRFPIAMSFATALTASLTGCSMGEMFERKDIARDVIPVTASPSHTGSIAAVNVAPESEEERRARSVATVIAPEGAGRIVRVKERHYPNGTRQEIVLGSDRAPGENVIDVSIRTREPDGRDLDSLMIGPPTENGMRNEILSRFPDVQMNIVTRNMRNGLGPFGLAIGRHASGARCVFAWQWIEDLREASPGSSNLIKLNAAMAGRGLATSLRIRLCRNDSTVDQLAAQIEGLRAGSRDAIERISTMDRRDIGSEPLMVSNAAPTAGTPLLRPVAGSLEAAMPGGRALPVNAAPTRSVAVAAARTTPVASSRTIKPRQIEPRRIAKPQRPVRAPARETARETARVMPPRDRQPIPAAPMPAAPAMQPYGQRYLAPIAQAAPPTMSPAHAPAMPSSLNLPPQALQGPAMR